MKTLYTGVNRRQSYIEMTYDDLSDWWNWSDKPFVKYTDDLISLTNDAWDISKSEARRNPAIKLPKGFDDFDFFVIQYGKQVHPHIPRICLLNPELFGLLEGEYKPKSVDGKFFWFIDFINCMGEFSEKDIIS